MSFFSFSTNIGNLYIVFTSNHSMRLSDWTFSILCRYESTVNNITVDTIIRPHRPYYVDAVYCYRPSSVVCRSVSRSVTLVSPAKTAESIEMPLGLRTRLGPGNHVLDGDPDAPIGRGDFEGGEASHCKARDTLQSSVQKRLNQSRCRLGCRLRESCVRWGFRSSMEGAIWGKGAAHCKV